MYMFLLVMEKEENRVSERNPLCKERHIFKRPVVNDKLDPELSVFFTQKIIPHMFEEGRDRLFTFTVIVTDCFFFLTNDLQWYQN